jgi:acetyl/propionyl-CoA carboxylase alpha subunit
MIRKILIANRGEIACRIARTCREMGIATVAVYSDADVRALHVEVADEAVYLGASPAIESYLNSTKIIEATKRTGADAVHPGYGFLAENAAFAQACIDAGLTFIGPPPNAIHAMGSKHTAKMMLKGIQMLPGYIGEDQSNQKLLEAAQEIGFPIMVKASAGGGGKGMRKVQAAEDLAAALDSARRESLQAFGDDRLILEKVVHQPRHIEVQIFGDQHGNVIALGERECTIQRRHQKLIEETPSPVMTSRLRTKMFNAAVSIGTQLGYYSAGTVEFLVDDKLNFYFMEMNTRLQVEHPVTEETTGLDLVRWQIMVAEGHMLDSTDVYPAGHAIEVRVYAEDPANAFLPATGKILRWREPDDIRVDGGIQSGDDFSIYYDPLVAKIIAYGEHRDGAIRRLDYALSQLQLLGLTHNVAFLRRVIMHPDHLAGNFTTGFIAEHPKLLSENDNIPPVALIATALAKIHSRPASQQAEMGELNSYWRNNPFRPIKQRFSYQDQETEVWVTPKGQEHYTVSIGEVSYAVRLWSYTDSEMSLSMDEHRMSVTVVEGAEANWWIHVLGNSYKLTWISPLPEATHTPIAEGSLRAPMPGQIRALYAEAGQHVTEGTVLIVVEAMKMEHQIKAPYAGRVATVHYRVGETVLANAILLELHSTDVV